MKKALIVMLVGVLIAVIGIGCCVGWYVKTADSMNEMYNYVKKTEADVQTQLQSRLLRLLRVLLNMNRES